MPKLLDSEFLSISVDETSDSSNNSLLSIIIYYLDKNLMTKNFLCGMPKLYGTTAEEISKTII